MAAEMLLGKPILQSKKQANLTLLSAKHRPNKKKSGRKRPRPEDIDAVPASDSVIMTSSVIESIPSRPSKVLPNAKNSKVKKHIHFNPAFSSDESDVSPASLDQNKDFSELDKEHSPPPLPCL